MCAYSNLASRNRFGLSPLRLMLVVGYLGVEPSLSCSQNRRIAVFLAPDSGTVYRVVTIIGDWIVLVKL